MIKAHPSAQAYKRNKRNTPTPISLKEYDEIHRQWESGMMKKDIAIAMKRTTGTIAYCIIHLTREDVMAREERKNSPNKSYVVERKEKDLSSLPATELFVHSKEYIL